MRNLIVMQMISNLLFVSCLSSVSNSDEVSTNSTSRNVGISSIQQLSSSEDIISSTPHLSISSSSTEQHSSSSITSENCIAYDRDLYKHWSDLNGDCRNTRHDVLNTLNRDSKTTECEVTSGEWFGVFDGITYTDPSGLDVDHIVPLAEAHRSGAHSWSAEEREWFANDFKHLALMSASQNRSKGDRDLAEWLPEDSLYRNFYVIKWVNAKAEYNLTIDSAEWKVIEKYITNTDSLLEEHNLVIEEERDCTGSEDIQVGDKCSEKSTCGEMASCEEAIFYLTMCGVDRLDGDGDGVPCESVCK